MNEYFESVLGCRIERTFGMVATVGNGVALPEQPEQRALDSVEKVLEANRLSRVAGKQLLAELPLQLTLRARLKSLLLLGIIFSCFWVSC